MITFLDGPAAGEELQLRRAPKFLRVTRSRRGEFDALDQLDDEARPTETLFAYRLVRYDGRYHVCIRGKGRGASGWYEQAEYALVADQPDELTMRDTPTWQSWCTKQPIEPEVQHG